MYIRLAEAERNNLRYFIFLWLLVQVALDVIALLSFRTGFRSSNALSSVSSWASIAVPRLGADNLLTIRVDDQTHLRSSRQRASVAQVPITLRCCYPRRSHSSLYFEDPVEVHSLWRRMLGPFQVMCITAAGTGSTHEVDCVFVEIERDERDRWRLGIG